MGVLATAQIPRVFLHAGHSIGWQAQREDGVGLDEASGLPCSGTSADVFRRTASRP